MTQLDERVKTCLIDDCDKRPAGAGLCGTHYARKRRGVPLDTPVRSYKTFDDPEGFRTCSECGKMKTVDEFYNMPNTTAKRRKCKQCMIETQ
jgi:hypothetical protein